MGRLGGGGGGGGGRWEWDRADCLSNIKEGQTWSNIKEGQTCYCRGGSHVVLPICQG